MVFLLLLLPFILARQMRYHLSYYLDNNFVAILVPTCCGYYDKSLSHSEIVLSIPGNNNASIFFFCLSKITSEKAEKYLTLSK